MGTAFLNGIVKCSTVWKTGHKNKPKALCEFAPEYIISLIFLSRF